MCVFPKTEQTLLVNRRAHHMYATAGSHPQRVTWAGVMCEWVTYPWTCCICDSCRSATWTSSAPCRSHWRLRDPSLASDRRSLSLSMVPAPPPSLRHVPPSFPSLPRVPPSLCSPPIAIGWWWQVWWVWWWSFGAPGDAPSSSWHRYFYNVQRG